jgi:hypothetical protein
MKFERHDWPPDTKIGSVFRQHPLKSSLPSIVATRSRHARLRADLRLSLTAGSKGGSPRTTFR